MDHRFDRARLACRKLRDTYSTRFVLYNAELHNKELHAERLINDMDMALSEKQFKVYYQPKYDITGEKPVMRSSDTSIFAGFCGPRRVLVYPNPGGAGEKAFE